MYMIIYKITNKVNNKIYIGQTTKNLKIRWSAHCSCRKNTAISNAIQKYGKENFVIEEIDGANSRSELNYREQYHIFKSNSIAPNGYNLSLGGKNSKHSEGSGIRKPRKKMTEETKLKIRNSKLGKKHTQEHKDKISKTLKGVPKTQEHKDNMKAASKKYHQNKSKNKTS